MLRAVCFTLLPLLALLAPRVSTAQEERSADERFLAGLRQRGLYGLAVKYCTDELKQPALADARRAELAIELSLTLAEQAVSSAPAERPALWKQAQDVVDDFARQSPASPRLLQVRLQGALNLLARGELARQEAELASGGEPAYEEARTWLREAVKQLQAVADEADALRRQLGREGPPGRGGDPPDRLSARQLESMLDNVRYELARAHRNQGQCYAAGSADRADALNQAVQGLDWLARLDAAHPLAWKSRIDQIVCYRLLGDLRTARQKLEGLAAQDPPAAVALRARAEEARLALAEKNVEQAMRLLAAGRELRGATSPELDLAILETCVAQWQAAKEAKSKELAEEWYGRAARQVRLIDRDYGPYWMRRAETLLAGSVGASPDTGDVASLVRAAEGFFRSQRWDDALAAYDRAREAAQRQGARERAFELGFIAATVEHQRNRRREALARYRGLALAWPDHPKAPQAHALAIQHAAELAKTGQQAEVGQYADLLAEHRRTWPRDPGADRVRWAAARLAEFQRDWPAAIQAYREISPSDPEYAAAVEAAGRASDLWLSDLKAAGKPVQKPAAESAAWFESVITGPENRLPERWSPAQQTAALVAARLWLKFAPAGHVRAEQVLSAAMEGNPEAAGQWKSDARSLLVYSLAASGKGREAAEALQGVAGGKPEQLLVMLEGLSQVAAGATPEVRAQVAGLQLRAVALLEPRKGELGEAVGRMLARVHAQALADAGQTAEALAAYRALAARNPRDARIQEGYAQLLVAQPDRASLEAALARWRELAANAQPSSDLWFRAKYHVALAHLRLGNKEAAGQLLRQMEILYPGLGGPELAPKFRGLLAECRK